MRDLIDEPRKPFYHSLNSVEGAFFSATKQKRDSQEPRTVTIKTKYGTTSLYLSTGVMPGHPEFRIMKASEYLWYYRYPNIDSIQADLDFAIARQTKTILDNRVTSKKSEVLVKRTGHSEWSLHEKQSLDVKTYVSVFENQLTEVEKQLVIYYAMYDLQNTYRLITTSSELTSLVNGGSNNTRTYRSLEILDGTLIQKSSTFRFGDHKEPTKLRLQSTPLLSFTRIEQRPADKLILTLNPFHLYQHLKRRWIDSDLIVLTTFRSPIAAYLCEFLMIRFSGTLEYGHEYFSWTYGELCDHIHVVRHTSYSLVKRQLETAFDELIQRGLIHKWEILNDMPMFQEEYGYSIRFYPHARFYRRYLNLIPDTQRKTLESLYAELKTDPSRYEEYARIVRYAERQLIDQCVSSESDKYLDILEACIQYYIFKKHNRASGEPIADAL